MYQSKKGYGFEYKKYELFYWFWSIDNEISLTININDALCVPEEVTDNVLNYLSECYPNVDGELEVVYETKKAWDAIDAYIKGYNVTPIDYGDDKDKFFAWADKLKENLSSESKLILYFWVIEKKKETLKKLG